MKVIITGATGFIGRNIAESMQEDGAEVTGLGRNVEIGKVLTEKGIEFLENDITDTERLIELFSNADYVVHSAGKSGDWGSYRDFYNNNVIGTRNIIEACKKHNIFRIVFISTPSVYYNGRDRLDILESDPLPKKMATNYAKTKFICENELFSSYHESGIKTIVLRPRAVYGAYDKTIIPRILKMAEKDQFPLIKGGKALTDITYINNLIEAVKLCLKANDDSWNEIYNISNGQSVTIFDWFSEMLQIFEKRFQPKTIPERAAKIIAGINELICTIPSVNTKPSMTRFSVGYMSKSMTMSIEKAKEKLGYSPVFSNSEGFQNYKEWLADNR